MSNDESNRDNGPAIDLLLLSWRGEYRRLRPLPSLAIARRDVT